MNRKAVRAAIAALLTAGVPAAQQIYDHQADDFDGQSPVICITSASSLRERLTMSGSRATLVVDVHTFVLYRDVAAGWTPANAENALDDLEAQIGAVLLANTRHTAWKMLAYDDRSEARDLALIGGTAYLHEVIPVAVHLF